LEIRLGGFNINEEDFVTSGRNKKIMSSLIKIPGFFFCCRKPLTEAKFREQETRQDFPPKRTIKVHTFREETRHKHARVLTPGSKFEKMAGI